MGKITFVLGGARSGKSAFVLGLAKKYKRVAFVATAEALDKEMRQRINLHREARPKHWAIFEESRDLIPLLERKTSKFEIIIIDCLTLWISNLLLKGAREAVIESETRKMIACLKKIKSKSFIVANEVGLGIVPENKLARTFRDIAGRINQIVAAKSDEVFFIVAGLSLQIK